MKWTFASKCHQKLFLWSTWRAQIKHVHVCVWISRVKKSKRRNNQKNWTRGVSSVLQVRAEIPGQTSDAALDVCEPALLGLLAEAEPLPNHLQQHRWSFWTSKQSPPTTYTSTKCNSFGITGRVLNICAERLTKQEVCLWRTCTNSDSVPSRRLFISFFFFLLPSCKNTNLMSVQLQVQAADSGKAFASSWASHIICWSNEEVFNLQTPKEILWSCPWDLHWARFLRLHLAQPKFSLPLPSLKSPAYSSSPHHKSLPLFSLADYGVGFPKT